MSADPKSFKLPAFSLAPLQQYTITVTVQTNFLSASSASVQVYIARSALVASIAGGHSRAVPANQTISLDASGSTPINNTAYGALSFRWSCLIFSGSLFGSDCTGLLANVSLLGPTLRFSSGLLSSNVTYQFTVAAALDADFDTASALISLAPVGAPSVSLSISASRANIGDVVQLDGVIGAESNTSTAWNVSSSSAAVNIASISTSPVTGVFPLSVLRPSIGVSLGINTLFLSTGASYTFELTASTSGKGDISTASILLTINTPPSGGFIFSVPTIGSAFSTLFRVSSIGWVVEAGGYPLVYDFKYSVVSNTSSSPYLLLAARGLQTFVESALPAGDSAFNSTIILQSTVYDIYGAFTTSTTNVSVNGNNQTGDSLVASLYDQLNASTLTFNTDLTLQSVNTVATSLGTNSLILNETAYDSVILSLCNALRGVISVSDGSAALLNTLVNSFGTVYDPSKVIQVQTLQTCSSLLTNVSTLIVTDLANILSPTVQSFAELLSNFATSVQKLSNSADCIGVMNVSSLSKCVTFSALSSELTLALNSLVSGVSGRLVPGQGSFLLSTANLNVAVFSNLHSSLGDTILTSLDAGASIMQRRLQTGSAVSHIELPSSGLDACGTSVSGYSRLALSQFTNNPYVSSSNLETPVLRVASYGSNYAVATIDPNASAVNFTMQLAFTSQQNLQITNGVIINTTFNGSYSTNYSSSQVPICTLRSGDTFVPCDCSLGTYTNDSAIFLCRLRTAFCGLASSSVGTSSPTSQPSMSSGLSSTYEQNPSIQEYGAFIQSIFEVIGTTFQPRNPFESDPSTSTIIVYVVVGCLLIFLIIGLFFLSRRDALDRKVLLYVPEEAAAKKNPVAMTNAELIAQRESLDDAFLSGALISEDDFNESHVEYDRRQRWVRKVNAMLAWLLPFSKQSRAQISLLVGGTLLPKYAPCLCYYNFN